MKPRVGDFFCCLRPTGWHTFKLFKITQIEIWRAHLIVFSPSSQMPSPSTLSDLSVELWHQAIPLDSLPKDPEIVDNLSCEGFDYDGYSLWLQNITALQEGRIPTMPNDAIISRAISLSHKTHECVDESCEFIIDNDLAHRLADEIKDFQAELKNDPNNALVFESLEGDLQFLVSTLGY